MRHVISLLVAGLISGLLTNAYLHGRQRQAVIEAAKDERVEREHRRQQDAEYRRISRDLYERSATFVVATARLGVQTFSRDASEYDLATAIRLFNDAKTALEEVERQLPYRATLVREFDPKRDPVLDAMEQDVRQKVDYCRKYLANLGL